MASKLSGKRGKRPRGGSRVPIEETPAAVEAGEDPGDDEDSSEEELDTRAIVEEAIRTYWEKQNEAMENLTEEDLRATPELPLARIKKIMKLDENVKMISSEVPLLFSKAATMFIEELTLKAWLHTEDAKRKTLQKSDIAKALSEDEMYDFLIDIVPRDESCQSKGPKSRAVSKHHSGRPDGVGADAEAIPSQNLFLSEDQIKACMELLRKQIVQEEKLQESWKNAEDIRPEVEIQLLIQQQLLQHQVLLQYLENLLEAKDGECGTSSQDIQSQISQLMGTSRRGLLEYLQQQQQREEFPEGLTAPHEMLGELEEGVADPDHPPSDAGVGETLLPPAPSHSQERDYALPSNFNFSNNNLFLDGASLLSPLDHPENPAAFSAGKMPADVPISSAYQLLDESIED